MGQPLNGAIEAIIFDKDGTLADSRPFLRDLAIARAKSCADVFRPERPEMANSVYDALIQAFGVTPTGLDPDGLMAVGTRPANEQVAINLYGVMGWSLENPSQLVAKLFAEADKTSVSKATQTLPFPGTGIMLHQLSLSPLKVGILSSDSTPNVTDFLQYYGFAPLINAWRGTDAGDRAKPNPDLFWELCGRMQVPAAKTLMVGDSWADLQVAQNAGAAAFVSVAEAWGRSSLPGSDYIIQDWEQLLRLVGGTDYPSQTVDPSL